MMAVARFNLGTTYKDQSDFEKAMEQYEASLLIMYKIYSQNLDHPQIIKCEQNLSVVIENYQAEKILGGRERNEIKLYNTFKSSCISFGYLSPETQLNLAEFNEHMAIINICNSIYIYIYIYKTI